MRSEGYGSLVCLSVCPCSNSLLDGIFVPQTIRHNKRVIRISLIERFSLKMLRCRDLSITSIVRVHSVAHFSLAENEHAHRILRPRGCPEEKDVRVCRELRFSLAIMPPSKVCPQCQASVPLKLKLCKCCQYVFQSKVEYSLSDQATKRMRVSKATKRASETSKQSVHRKQKDRKCKASTSANETSEKRKQKCKASMRATKKTVDVSIQQATSLI